MLVNFIAATQGSRVHSEPSSAATDTRFAIVTAPFPAPSAPGPIQRWGRRLPGGRARRAAFMGHAAGEQAAHRVEAAERMGDEAILF